MTHIIGLTGGIASGKSLVADTFRSLHIPVYDADQEVHRLLREDREVIDAVRKRFGVKVIADGVVDRRALGAVIFHQPDVRKQLEAILHPKLAGIRDRFVETHRGRASKVILLDIPLLFETGADQHCDAVWMVMVTPELQIERALARGKHDKATLNEIIAAQGDLAAKAAKADVIIDNNGSKAATRETVERLLTPYL